MFFLSLATQVSAQDRPPPGPADLRSIEFEGARSFSDFALKTAILSTTSACKYLPLLGLCLFGRDRREVDPLALQGDVLRLRVFYFERGYREAKVSVDSTRSADAMSVTFHITEGRPVLVGSVSIGGLDELDPSARRVVQNALEKLPLRASHSLNLIDYESARDTLLNRLHNVGYGRSDVFGSYTIPRDSPYIAHVGYDVIPGNRVYFGRPNITNNEKVSANVIRKMLAFRRGDLYTREAILRSQRNLFGLEVFRNVDVHVDLQESAGDTVVPHIDVLEGSLNRFRVGAGVSTSEFINAEGRWIRRDFLGGARRLEIRGRVTNLAAQQLSAFKWFESAEDPYDRPGGSLSLDVTQPWFFDAANSFAAGVFIERRSIPNVFVRTAQGGYLAATRALAPTATITLGYRPERTRLDAEDLIFCVSFTTCEAADIRILRDPHWLAPLTATFARDRSNSLFAPTRGSIVRMESEYAASATGSEFGYARILAEWITYHEPVRGLVLATRVRPGWATSVNEPGRGLGLHPQKRFFAGGPNSVRGFGQYQLGPKLLKIDAENQLLEPDTESGFPGCTAQAINAGDCDVALLADSTPGRFELRPVGGAAALEGNVEIRFPVIGEKLRGAAFVDFGQVWSQAKDLHLSDLVWTPGAGLRYFSAIGPIRVDVGYNTQGTQLLSVLTNKLCLRTVDPCSPDSVKDGETYTRDELRNSGTLTRLDDVAFGANRGFLDRLQLHFSIGQAF